MEFKGTKGKWEMRESHTKLETSIKCGLIRVAEAKHYNTGGNDWAKNDPDYETGKYNALLISKAPEMLEFIIMVYNTMPDRSIIKEKANELIKEATEI